MKWEKEEEEVEEEEAVRLAQERRSIHYSYEESTTALFNFSIYHLFLLFVFLVFRVFRLLLDTSFGYSNDELVAFPVAQQSYEKYCRLIHEYSF